MESAGLRVTWFFQPYLSVSLPGAVSPTAVIVGWLHHVTQSWCSVRCCMRRVGQAVLLGSEQQWALLPLCTQVSPTVM